jgi:hypothetical protein
MFCLVPGKMHSHIYRKVVLSAFPGGAAMLITHERFGVPTFVTAEDAAWRLAPSREGVEDAVHHNGRFYSVTCSGTEEVWERDAHAGDFTSAAVTPRIGNASCNTAWRRKYLVVVPGGRLMVVLKGWKRGTNGCKRWACSLKVLVLDGAQWKGTDDIGDAALFVGANQSLYVSTRVHPELKPGHVYYTEDDLIHASPHDVYKGSSHYEDEDHRGVGVFCLKDGTVEDLEGLGQYPSWPPPAWFMPSIP